MRYCIIKEEEKNHSQFTCSHVAWSNLEHNWWEDLWQGGWRLMVLKAPSNPSHSVTCVLKTWDAGVVIGLIVAWGLKPASCFAWGKSGSRHFRCLQHGFSFQNSEVLQLPDGLTIFFEVRNKYFLFDRRLVCCLNSDCMKEVGIWEADQQSWHGGQWANDAKVYKCSLLEDDVWCEFFANTCSKNNCLVARFAVWFKVLRESLVIFCQEFSCSFSYVLVTRSVELFLLS